MTYGIEVAGWLEFKTIDYKPAIFAEGYKEKLST